MYKYFKKAVRKVYPDYVPILPYNHHYSVGDWGEVSPSGNFKKLGDAAAFRKQFGITLEADSPEPIEAFKVIKSSKTNAVSVTGDLEAGAAGASLAEGSVQVSLEGKKGVYVLLRNSRIRALKNLYEVAAQIVELSNQGGWDPKIVVISRLVEAESGVYLLNAGQDTTVSISAAGTDLPGSVLTNPKLDLSLSFQSSFESPGIIHKKHTPIIDLDGIKRRAFGKTVFRARGEAEEEVPFYLSRKEFALTGAEKEQMEMDEPFTEHPVLTSYADEFEILTGEEIA